MTLILLVECGQIANLKGEEGEGRGEETNEEGIETEVQGGTRSVG